MKTAIRWIVMLGLVLRLGACGLRAQPDGSGPLPRAVPGAEWAQTLSTITGVAISPLLGVGAVGAWKYFKTPTERRARLPWFARPYFWAPALLLIALAFAKDAMGPLIPTVLKKPFDVAEVIENKVSALIAVGAFVPLMVTVFPSAGAEGARWLGASGMAVVDFAWIGNALLTPFAMAAFLLVWLAAHAINVLILVSPFATVDLGLKSLRLALLSSVTFTAFADPYWGAAWSAVLIVLGFFLAGWSFRLTVFGTVFAWDLVTLRRARFRPNDKGNLVFTACRIEQVPVRTCGLLRRDANGRLMLQYRPWLVLAPRTVLLPAGTYAIGKGLLHPDLLLLEPDREAAVASFPPRCRTHDEELDRLYQLGGVRPIGLVAVWAWFKELFGFTQRPATRPA